MRFLIFVLFFSLPCTARASVAMPINIAETAIARQGIPHGFAPKKQGFFEQFLEKKLIRRLKKAAGPSRNDGTGFAVAGLIAFLLNVVSWVLSPLLGIFAILPLAIIGLIFSFISLYRAKRWHVEGLSKRLAILGIVMNGIALVSGIAIWIIFLNGF